MQKHYPSQIKPLLLYEQESFKGEKLYRAASLKVKEGFLPLLQCKKRSYALVRTKFTAKTESWSLALALILRLLNPINSSIVLTAFKMYILPQNWYFVNSQIGWFPVHLT